MDKTLKALMLTKMEKLLKEHAASLMAELPV